MFLMKGGFTQISVQRIEQIKNGHIKRVMYIKPDKISHQKGQIVDTIQHFGHQILWKFAELQGWLVECVC